MKKDCTRVQNLNPRRLRSAGPRLAHLATRIFNVPLLIHPQKMDVILSVLGPHLGLRAESLPVLAYDDWDEDDAPSSPAPDRQPGLCVIPIHGFLVKRSSGMDALSGGPTSYLDIQSVFSGALADDMCTGIVLDIDSPGGEVSGMFDLANLISGSRGQKPIVGIANDDAYSAACCLLSACDKVFVTQVGGTGSIGCYMLHCDMSGYDKKNGLDYKYIFSGAKKVNGNPHAPLTGVAFDEAQQEVDRIRQMFVQSVARNRNVDAQSLFDTEAACFMGAESCPMLADAVGTLGDAIELCDSMAKKSVSVPVPALPAASSAVPQVERRGPLQVISASLREREAIAELFQIMASPGSLPWADYQFENGGPVLAVRKFGSATLAAADEECACACKACVAGNCSECANEDCDDKNCEGCPMQGDEAEPDDEGKATISGVLAPYGSESIDLGGFVEVYEPGCFAESLQVNDLRCLYNHNVDYVLGRKSAGTARFWEDKDGLHYSAELPRTQVARDLAESMKRGDIRESSCAFYILEQRKEKQGGKVVRYIEKAKLVEGGPHSFAAYPSTSARTEQPAALAPFNEIELLRFKSEQLMIA